MQIEAVEIREEFEERGRKLEAEIRSASILPMSPGLAPICLKFVTWLWSPTMSYICPHSLVPVIYHLQHSSPVKPNTNCVQIQSLLSSHQLLSSERSLRHEVRRRGRRLRRSSVIVAMSLEREVSPPLFFFFFSFFILAPCF